MNVSKKAVAEAIRTLHRAGFINWERNDGDGMKGNAVFYLLKNEGSEDRSVLSLSVKDGAVDGGNDVTQILPHITEDKMWMRLFDSKRPETEAIGAGAGSSR
jgi:hypothetical protein